MSILGYLRDIFTKESDFLVITLEKMLAVVEVTLCTHFQEPFTQEQAEEPCTFNIIDSLDDTATPLDRIYAFLLNTRETVAILTNLLINQIKLLIRMRVMYSRDEFNFENYHQIAMSDERTVAGQFFIKSGKALVGDFFKFQQTVKDKANLNFELTTYNEVYMVLHSITPHLKDLYQVHNMFGIESLLCKQYIL